MPRKTMKALPCHSCLVFPICKNRTLVDIIYKCRLMKKYLFKAKSINKLYNRINSMFNIRVPPRMFKLFIDTVKLEEDTIIAVAKNLRDQIDKDIIDTIIKEARIANEITKSC
jgi:superfamily II helicase